MEKFKKSKAKREIKMYERNRHNEKAIYSVTAREKQNLAVPPERNTPSVPSITERSGCNPKPPTADTKAMLNTVTAIFSKILPKLKKPIKRTKLCGVKRRFSDLCESAGCYI